jgi:IS6 family transposase
MTSKMHVPRPLSVFHAVCSVLAALVFVSNLCGPLSAQLSTTATITGTVTDGTGAVVPDATVTVVDLATKTTTIHQSNSDGTFVVPGLPVDTYSVTIAKRLCCI